MGRDNDEFDPGIRRVYVAMSLFRMAEFSEEDDFVRIEFFNRDLLNIETQGSEKRRSDI